MLCHLIVSKNSKEKIISKNLNYSNFKYSSSKLKLNHEFGTCSVYVLIVTFEKISKQLNRIDCLITRIYLLSTAKYTTILYYIYYTITTTTTTITTTNISILNCIHYHTLYC